MRPDRRSGPRGRAAGARRATVTLLTEAAIVADDAGPRARP